MVEPSEKPERSPSQNKLGTVSQQQPGRDASFDIERPPNGNNSSEEDISLDTSSEAYEATQSSPLSKPRIQISLKSPKTSANAQSPSRPELALVEPLRTRSEPTTQASESISMLLGSKSPTTANQSSSKACQAHDHNLLGIRPEKPLSFDTEIGTTEEDTLRKDDQSSNERVARAHAKTHSSKVKVTNDPSRNKLLRDVTKPASDLPGPKATNKPTAIKASSQAELDRSSSFKIEEKDESAQAEATPRRRSSRRVSVRSPSKTITSPKSVHHGVRALITYETLSSSPSSDMASGDEDEKKQVEQTVDSLAKMTEDSSAFRYETWQKLRESDNCDAEKIAAESKTAFEALGKASAAFSSSRLVWQMAKPPPKPSPREVSLPTITEAIPSEGTMIKKTMSAVAKAPPKSKTKAPIAGAGRRSQSGRGSQQQGRDRAGRGEMQARRRIRMEGRHMRLNTILLEHVQQRLQAGQGAQQPGRGSQQPGLGLQAGLGSQQALYAGLGSLQSGLGLQADRGSLQSGLGLDTGRASQLFGRSFQPGSGFGPLSGLVPPPTHTPIRLLQVPHSSSLRPDVAIPPFHPAQGHWNTPPQSFRPLVPQQTQQTQMSPRQLVPPPQSAPVSPRPALTPPRPAVGQKAAAPRSTVGLKGALRAGQKRTFLQLPQALPRINNTMSARISKDQIRDAIPENASCIFHIFDRRVNLDAHAPDASFYSLMRSWVQDDPYRQIPPPGSNLLDYVSLPSERRIETTTPVLPRKRPCEEDGACDVIAELSKEISHQKTLSALREQLVIRCKCIKRQRQKEHNSDMKKARKSLESVGIVLPIRRKSP